MAEGQITAVLVVASDIYGRSEAKRRECSRGWDERGFAGKEERRILSNFGNYPVSPLRKFAFGKAPMAGGGRSFRWCFCFHGHCERIPGGVADLRREGLPKPPASSGSGL